MGATKVVILPQYVQRKVVDYPYNNINLLVGKYFSVEQKYIQHLHMLTYDEYMKKLTTISISSFHLIEISSTITV